MSDFRMHSVWAFIFFLITHVDGVEGSHISSAYCALKSDATYKIDKLVDDFYRPSPELLELLQIVGMDKSLNTIDKINEWTQSNLLREGERWDNQKRNFEPLKSRLMPYFVALGFIDARNPQFKSYEGAIVHGALLNTVKKRLLFLADQWKSGVRFPKLYFLSGDRPLNRELEDIDSLLPNDLSRLKGSIKLPNTECEMIKVIWDTLIIPDEMRKSVEVYFICSPMKMDLATLKKNRPNTEDTVRAWLETFPLPGRYLAVSNAPYIHRQDIVVKSIAPKVYLFETVGAKASDQADIAIILDELARSIYQINKRRLSNN